MLAQELEPEDQLQMQGRKPLVGEAQACFLGRVQCFEEESTWNPEQVMLPRMGRRCAGWVSLLSSSREVCCAVTPSLNRKRELCVDSGLQHLWLRAQARRAAIWTATTAASRDCTLAVVESCGRRTEAMLWGNSVLSEPF